MKIVHLNTYDGNGGAGRACLRLNKALNDQGVDSYIWVNYQFGRNKDIKSFNSSLIGRALTAFKILFERFVSSAVCKKLKIPFSVPVFGNNIAKHPALKEADIIHLHWINHAFLRPRDLSRLKRLNKPIVWTFHDSNAFTGGCHVRYSCPHYQNECGNCPLLKNSAPNDLSHKIWKKKNRAYSQLDFSIIAPSFWMKQSVSKSKLLSFRPIRVIPNTLDTAVFKPIDKRKAREKAGFKPESFIMLSGFMPSRNDLHKGTPYLLQALDIFMKQHKASADQIELLVFGNRDEKNLPEFPFKTTFAGTIQDDEKLALYYSAADVFLTPSLEDNLPNTVMESLSCGTPVVAFTTGGIPDMVSHQFNGYLAEYRSAEDFAAGISWVFQHLNRNELTQNARHTVMERFSEVIVAQNHIELYQRLLK